MSELIALTGAELDSIGSSTGFVYTGVRGTIGAALSDATPYVFGLAGFALVVYIVFSGYALLMSKGDPRAVEAAKGQFTNAIIGFVVIFVSYWVVQLVGDILGIQAINTIF